MLLEEGDTGEFKQWLLPKLENISDADAPVLADYVIALVIADDSGEDVRRNCIGSLEDFLGENTEPLVNDVIATLQDKSYLSRLKAKPQAPQSIRSIVGNANFEYEPHPSNVPFDAPRGPAAARFPHGSHAQTPSHTAQQDGLHQSRKRKLVEGEADLGQDSHYNRTGHGNNRPLKQTSRDRGGWTARDGGREQRNSFPGFAAMPNFTNLPPPPPGPPPFDPTNPAAFVAMAAAFGLNLPLMPSLPFPGQSRGADRRGPKMRCTNYHDKGFCSLGNICQFEHGDAIEVPIEEVPEYDPERSFLAVQPSGGFNSQAATRSQPGGKERMNFSLQGKQYNFTNTAIVAKPIPKEYFSKDSVQVFFSQFGSIVDIEMHDQELLVIVKYENNSAAARAYKSPKAIFDNRFVKVYWYNPADFGRPLPMETYGDTVTEDVIDGEEKLGPAEIARRQKDAQRAFNERRRKAGDTDAKAAEIERKLEEKREQIEKIKTQLAGLSGENTEELTQSLAALQAEAEKLFVQHEPSVPAVRGGHLGRGRGARFYARGGNYPPLGRGYTPSRGAYRGRGDGTGYTCFRGTYRGRGDGLGHTPSRGAYRVRGNGFAPAPRQNPSKKLDNRPRRMAVADIKADTPRDEALRQYLLNVTGLTSIERHLEQTDALILTFDERYQAEMFVNQSLDIPDVGDLSLAWIPNDAFGGIKAVTTTTAEEIAALDHKDDDDDDASSATIGEQEIKVEEEDGQELGVEDGPEQQRDVDVDVDLDVAEDVDQWL